MAEPTEEDVNNLCDMFGATTDLDKQMFVRALKDNNREISKVVDLWFTGEDSFRSKYSWDEGQFMAERDGSNIPSFAVQGPDQLPPNSGEWPQAGGHPAPSRPPSRAQNRSPLGKMVDWATDYTVGTVMPFLVLTCCYYYAPPSPPPPHARLRPVPSRAQGPRS